MCVDVHVEMAPSLGLSGDGLIVGRAVDVDGGREEMRDVGDDGGQRAAQGAVVCNVQGNDDIVLVPDVKGVGVGVGEDGGHVQRAGSL